MGFLIFAYRKLSLKRQINQDEARLMQLSREVQDINSQKSLWQQAQSDKKDMTEQYMAGISSKFMTDNQGLMAGQATGAQMMMMAKYQDAMMQAKMYTNSVFSAADKGMEQSLKAKGDRIDLEKATVESQLKLENAEYQEIVKAEDASAKENAPKFGLS